MIYTHKPCEISALSKKTAKSPQPPTSFSKTLRNRNISKRLPARYWSPRIATARATFSMLLCPIKKPFSRGCATLRLNLSRLQIRLIPAFADAGRRAGAKKMAEFEGV